MDYKRLSEMIYKRRSVRKYKKGALSEERKGAIKAAIAELVPLYPDIRCELSLVCRADVRTLMPWMPEDAVAVYTDSSDGALENAGFMLEQLDLAVQAMGLGSCWVGLGRVKNKSIIPEGLDCVMLLALGETELAERSSAADFKRKALADISDSADTRLEAARLAPSSVNSQPWYFVEAEGGYDVYKLSLVRTSGLSRMNVIDVGIALAHLFVSYPESFRAERRLPAPTREGGVYITTVRI